MLLKQGHLLAAAGQGMRQGRPGNTGPDNHGVTRPTGTAPEPGRRVGGAVITATFACQHFPLAAKALDAGHLEAGFVQPAAHKAGGSKGGEGGAIARQTGQLCEQLWCPHLGILARCKAVQIPGIHLAGQAGFHLRQQFGHVAKPQIQAHIVGQMQPMTAADGGRIFS